MGYFTDHPSSMSSFSFNRGRPSVTCSGVRNVASRALAQPFEQNAGSTARHRDGGFDDFCAVAQGAACDHTCSPQFGRMQESEHDDPLSSRPAPRANSARASHSSLSHALTNAPDHEATLTLNLPWYGESVRLSSRELARRLHQSESGIV